MEPVQGSTSGHLQLEYMKPLVDTMHACLCIGGPSPPSFVGSDYYCESGNSADNPLPIVYSNDTLWDDEGHVMDLRVHAVIHQTSRGSARSFVSQLLTTWSYGSVGMRISATRITIDLVQLYIQ